MGAWENTIFNDVKILTLVSTAQNGIAKVAAARGQIIMASNGC